MVFTHKHVLFSLYLIFVFDEENVRLPIPYQKTRLLDPSTSEHYPFGTFRIL
jgi:hypothetical protein